MRTPNDGGTARRRARAAAGEVRDGWAFEGSQSIWTIAEASGCFKRAGLNVTIERSFGSGDSVVKVASGTYDVGVSDFSTMVGFDGKNPDKRLIAFFMVSDRAPMSIVTKKSAGITKPADLIGKRIADSVTEASRVMFPAFAKANGIDPEKVDWVTISPDLRQQMLVRDQADALAGHMFTILTGLAAVGLKQDDTSVMLYDDWGVHFFGNALVATPAWIAAHPDAAKAFAACAAEGIKLSMANPQAAIDSLRPRNTILNDSVELASLAFSNTVAIRTPQRDEEWAEHGERGAPAGEYRRGERCVGDCGAEGGGCLDGCLFAASGGVDAEAVRKVFFSVEKKQKTLLYLARAGTADALRRVFFNRTTGKRRV